MTDRTKLRLLPRNIKVIPPYRRAQPRRLDKRRQVKPKCLSDLLPRDGKRSCRLVQQADVAMRIRRSLGRGSRAGISDGARGGRGQSEDAVGGLTTGFEARNHSV